MSSYLIFLGRSSELAQAELSVFFPSNSRISDDIFQVDTDSFSFNGSEVPIQKAVSVLGGVVKIAVILEEKPNFGSQDFARLLASDSPSKIIFGISTYGGVKRIPQSAYQEVKTLLTNSGKAVRFVLPQDDTYLSTVVVAKQGVQELNICMRGDSYIVSKTIALQEFEEWSKRDYDRPFADSKRGMLPPKVCRMAVNLALGAEGIAKTVLDPFCGMGTIPNEVVLRGAIAMASDNDQEAVEKAKKNSSWLRSIYKTLPPVTYFTADATHLSGLIREESIDAIVTEPFMGSTKLGEGKITDPKEIRNILKGLEKLYKGCLKEWYPLLKPNGKVVIAIPEVVIGKTVYSVKNIIDSCETLGYTYHLGPYGYSRPQAVVRRMFYTLLKK